MTSTGDASIPEDGVCVEVELRDGRVYRKELEHSLGNLERPLSDRQLEDKFRNQASVLPQKQVDALIGACWRLEELEDVGRFQVPGRAY